LSDPAGPGWKKKLLRGKERRESPLALKKGKGKKKGEKAPTRLRTDQKRGAREKKKKKWRCAIKKEKGEKERVGPRCLF